MMSSECLCLGSHSSCLTT